MFCDCTRIGSSSRTCLLRIFTHLLAPYLHALACSVSSRTFLLRIFVSLNYLQLRHLYVTSVAPVRSLLLVSGNLPSPYSGCQMASAGFLRCISMSPLNLPAWRRGRPNLTPPYRVYRVSMGHCIITCGHGITEVTSVLIRNAMFILSSEAHLNP